MQELIFPVEQEKDGAFIVRAADKSILVRGENMPEVASKILAALRATRPQGPRVRILFKFEKVRTLSLIAHLAAVYAWILEISLVLLHVFTKVKLGTPSQVIILIVLLAMSGFAWHRRQDLLSLRYARGRIPLKATQCFVVIAFVISLGFTGTLIMILASNH